MAPAGGKGLELRDSAIVSFGGVDIIVLVRLIRPMCMIRALQGKQQNS
jgi:hypothetical protein